MDLLSARKVCTWTLCVALLCAVSACGEDGPRPWKARGVVYDTKPEIGQVLIDHEEIPGLMAAMTMTFDVPDPALLARLAPGQVIEFDLDTSAGRYRLVAFEVVGEATEEDGWVRFGDVLVLAAQAPAVELIDHAGQPFSLASLEGRGVLLDFMFTHCPGPCPILTTNHVAVQRALSPATRARTHFVSISLDPANDDPAALRAYATARGADLSTWTFLTGPPEQVEPVVSAFGVGKTRAPDGTIEHMVITFVIDGRGRIVKRYFGLEHDPKAIAKDLETLVTDAPAAG